LGQPVLRMPAHGQAENEIADWRRRYLDKSAMTGFAGIFPTGRELAEGLIELAAAVKRRRARGYELAGRAQRGRQDWVLLTETERRRSWIKCARPCAC
jgi:hypothetical protein